MSPGNAQLALDDAYRQLHDLVERYGPLNRGKGVNLFEGVDMIDHQAQRLPLNKLGVMVVAAAKIKQWEAIVGQGYVDKLDEDQARAQKDEDALKLLDIARIQSDGKQPVKSQHPALRCKPSSVIVNKRYLHRLELENDLYRRHLSRYEQGVTDKFVSLVTDILSGTQGDGRGPDAGNGHQDDSGLNSKPRKKRLKTASQLGGKGSPGDVILEEKFSDNRDG